MGIRFRCERLSARFEKPGGSETVTPHVEVRFDPLLGTSSRIAEGVKLQTADTAALARFQLPDPSCPFCPERVNKLTPRIHPDISSEPRIRVGETVLFPNLVPYSQYAAVAVFSSKHWLDVSEFSPSLIADNLFATLRYVKAVHDFDSRALYASWNINYLYPSGGSLPHPHSQIFLDPFPTTMLRLQLEAADRYRSENRTNYWDDLVTVERERNERFLWDLGSTAWMTSFAPLGFNEVRAVVRGRETLLQLSGDDVNNLALGLSRVLRWYGSLGYNSFNLSLFSGPLDGSPSHRVNMLIVTRSALVPYYRSDSMHLERLHWEAAVDRTPEVLAEKLRSHV